MIDIRHLTPNDVPLMKALLTTFGEAFNEQETYTSNPRVTIIWNDCSAVIPSLRWQP